MSFLRAGILGTVVLAAAAFACQDLSDLNERRDAGGGEEDDAGENGGGGKDSGGAKDSGNGGTDADAPPSSRCDPNKDYEPPELVVELDSASTASRAAVLTPDELDAYFTSYSGSAWTLRHAHRTSRSAKFAEPTTVPMTPPPVAALSLAAGGTRLYYWASTGASSVDCVTTRSGSGDFAVSSQLNTTTDTYMFFATANNDQAYFGVISSGDGGSTQKQLMVAPLSANGFTKLASSPVANIHATGSDDDYPVLNQSETILYFASTKRSLSLGSAYDIWVARRASKTAQFGSPTLVASLSTQAAAENVSWVSDDDCEVFIDRASHIYRAVRPQ